MKTRSLILVSLGALLAACGSTSPGTHTPTPPASPFNPNASTVQSSDPRVPYSGDWVWAVVFPDDSSYTGVISITQKGNSTANFVNPGIGAAAVCNDATCPVVDDLAVVGSLVSTVDGTASLTVAQATQAGSVRWFGLDDDGVVGTEFEGKPTLTGGALWDPSSDHAVEAAFAMAQVSTNSSAGASRLPSGARLAALARLKAPISAQRLNHMRARALAVVGALAQQH